MGIDDFLTIFDQGELVTVSVFETDKARSQKPQLKIFR